jgi:hypothetical protein
LFFGKLIFQLLNKGKKIDTDLVRFRGVHDEPVISRRIFRYKVRPVQPSGRAVLANLQCTDEIEPQMR